MIFICQRLNSLLMHTIFYSQLVQVAYDNAYTSEYTLINQFFFSANKSKGLLKLTFRRTIHHSLYRLVLVEVVSYLESTKYRLARRVFGRLSYASKQLFSQSPCI